MNDQIPPNFDWKKAKSVAGAFRVLFSEVPDQDRPWQQWQLMLHTFASLGLFEPVDVVGFKGRQYLLLYVPTEDEMEEIYNDHHYLKHSFGNRAEKQSPLAQKQTLVNFSRACAMAIPAQAGVAFVISRSQKEGMFGMITYGGVWSYYHFGDVCGPPQVIDCAVEALRINRDHPYEAIIDPESTRIESGTPSEEFFPQYVQSQITEEIKRETGKADLSVEYKLYQDYKFALRHHILIRPSVEFESDDQRNNIMLGLRWYMPLRIPVATEANGHIVTYQSF